MTMANAIKKKAINGRPDISIFVGTGMSFCSYWSPRLRASDQKTVDFHTKQWRFGMRPVRFMPDGRAAQVPQ